VAALLTMGVSTVAIGALPTYQSIGIAAPILLALCRFGQGLGLGGEWGGAVLLGDRELRLPASARGTACFRSLAPRWDSFSRRQVFLVLTNFLGTRQFPPVRVAHSRSY
jgi:MFS family permease